MKNKSFYSLKYLLLLYLLVTVALPILYLFSTIRGEHVQEILTSVQFLPMLKNSVVTTLIATVISIVLSFLLAWHLNRSNIRFKSVFVVLFTLPMLIPSISHGMGLVQLFGDNGLITNLLGWNIGLYGYKGIVMEAFGLGGVNILNEGLAGIRAAIDSGISVVITTQCLYDSSDLRVYQVGNKLLELGVIQGKDMTTEAAMTKLMWAIGQNMSQKEIRRLFTLSLAGEVN